MKTEVTILKWEKYQDSREVKSPWWFKVHNETWRSGEFSHLSAEEKVVWYALLALSSKEKKPTISFESSWFATIAGVSEGSVLSALEKMEELSWLKSNCGEIRRNRGKSGEIRAADEMRREEIRAGVVRFKKNLIAGDKDFTTTARASLLSPKSDAQAAQESIFEIWNAHSPPLRACKTRSQKRLVASRCRWKEHPDKLYWEKTIARLSKSSFATGGGDRGWRADIDWFLKPDSHIKISEGKYDDKDSARKSGLSQEEIKALWD